MLADSYPVEQWPLYPIQQYLPVKTQNASIMNNLLGIEEVVTPVDLDLGHHMGTVPTSPSSCPMFSDPLTSFQTADSPEPSDNPALLLDDSLLELCLQSIQSDIKMSSEGQGPDPAMACIDNPMFDSFSDLTSILDPSMSLSLPFPCADPLPNMPPALIPTTPTSPTSSDDVSPLSPLSSLCSSIASSPVDVNNRKRKCINDDSDVSTSPLPESKVSKQDERRIKNNAASKVSRAKRRAKVSNLFTREKELETENAKLRLQVEEMTQEAEKLKKLLISRLAATN